MKKIVSILLCVVMLASMLTVFPYAVENTESPTVDGVVNVGEYMTERTFNNLDPDGTPNTSGHHVDFAPWGVAPDGVDIIEYASEDDAYIYIAFVVNRDISEPDFFMTGRAEAAATVSEHLNTTRFYFDLSSADQASASVSESLGKDNTAFDTDGTEMRAYRSNEYEAIAKRNKNGNAFQNVTVEIKILKDAIEEVCRVPSVEFIGYEFVCRGMADYSGTPVELCARVIDYSVSDSGFDSFEALTDCYVGENEFYLHEYDSSYGYKMVRFICFYEEPEVKAWYGPEGTKSSDGVERAPVLDYTDIGRISTTSTYVAPEKEISVIDPPVVDGVVNEGEYTSSKVYADEVQFAWTGSEGVTITEYASHDEDYVYFALVYDTEVSEIEVVMNGSANVRYDWDAAELYGWFTFSDIDEAGVFGAYTKYNFGDLTHVSLAKTTDGRTAAEMRITKASMKSAFGVSSVDAFGYYANATPTETRPISNKTYLTNGQMEANGFTGRESQIQSEYGLGDWYPSACVLMNIVVLNGVLPVTPTIYCPSSDDCTAANHANRAEVFDLADLRDFGLLPGNFVPKLGEDVFTITVAFGSMSFNYISGDGNTWNPETHQYEQTPSGWVCDQAANKLIVRNLSDFAIITSFVYQKGQSFSGIDGSFDTAVARLAGSTDENSTTSRVVSYLELNGELASNHTQETEIGQIIIKLTRANS